MKITAVQLNYIVADFEYNFAKIKQAMIKHKDQDLIIFSELNIIGYYPYDLLVYPEIIKQQNAIIERIRHLTHEYKTAVIIGVVRAIDGLKKFHNAALVIDQGQIVFEYHKKLMPSYGIFDESRHFIAGEGQPFFEFRGRKLALFICEDIWFDNHQGYDTNPVATLEHHKLDAVIAINASPSMIGKFKQRLSIAQKINQLAAAPFIYVSQVGGYDEIVYDGSSFISNKEGELVALASSFDEDAVSVDLDRLPKSALGCPFHNSNEWLLKQLMLGLSDYLKKCGFTQVVVGSSGGIDSAVTLAIASLALGAENVSAITMPSVYSSKGSVDDSVKLCENLGVELFTRPIIEDYKLSVDAFETAFGKSPAKLTRENMQARIRGRVVMEYANDDNRLMLTTGNKSELAVGYATLYGDMNGALNCIGDLYKHEVYELAAYINEAYGDLIPQAIIDKAPSAELSEGQKDADSLPDYYYLDAMLKLYIERDLLPEDEIVALEKIVSEVDIVEQKRIYRLVELNEFKRKQAPQILIVHKRPFGIGRRMPVTAHFQKV
ncbi:MAG: NAD+ synthase [Francisellaceae bacterium]